MVLAVLLLSSRASQADRLCRCRSIAQRCRWWFMRAGSPPVRLPWLPLHPKPDLQLQFVFPSPLNQRLCHCTGEESGQCRGYPASNLPGASTCHAHSFNRFTPASHSVVLCRRSERPMPRLPRPPPATCTRAWQHCGSGTPCTITRASTAERAPPAARCGWAGAAWAGSSGISWSQLKQTAARLRP